MVTVPSIQNFPALGRSLPPGFPEPSWLQPTSVAELAEGVARNAQAGKAMTAVGAGSKLDWGGLVRPQVLVSLTGLDQLIEHAVGDLTVTVESGIRLADLQQQLAQAGQFLALDPTYPQQATVGGILAVGDGGSLRQRYGSLRDMVLGITLVRADGQIAQAGGRVVKNVAGYDLMKLLTGSYGTLGLIAQVTLRVYPLPAFSQTLVLRDPISAMAENLAQLRTQVLLSSLTPTSLDVVANCGEAPYMALRFQGSDAGVRAQTEQLTALAKGLGMVPEVQNSQLWDDLTLRHSDRDRVALTAKVGVQANQAIALTHRLQALLSDQPWSLQLHGGSGLGRLRLDQGHQITAELVAQLRQACQAEGGFFTLLQAPVELKQQVEVWGYRADALPVMRAVKAQFDPQHLLSPGRFVGGI